VENLEAFSESAKTNIRIDASTLRIARLAIPLGAYSSSFCDRDEKIVSFTETDGTRISCGGFFPVRLRSIVPYVFSANRLNNMESEHHERKDLGSLAGTFIQTRTQALTSSNEATEPVEL
jgi:hypothetical protein